LITEVGLDEHFLIVILNIIDRNKKKALIVGNNSLIP
jgi:hypothetical protein